MQTPPLIFLVFLRVRYGHVVHTAPAGRPIDGVAASLSYRRVTRFGAGIGVSIPISIYTRLTLAVMPHWRLHCRQSVARARAAESHVLIATWLSHPDGFY